MSAPLRPPKPPADPLARAIIELVAVFREWVHRTDLSRALGKLGHRVGTRAPTGADVLPIVAMLKAEGHLLGDSSWRVPPELAHATLLRMAREGTLSAAVAAVRAVRPASRDSHGHRDRELRIALYSGQWDAARALMSAGFAWVGEPFDAGWVAALPDDIRLRALMEVLDGRLRALLPCDEPLAMLAAHPAPSDGAYHLRVEQALLRGCLEEAEALLEERPSLQAQVGRGWSLALRGRWDESIAAYEAALTAFLKRAGKRARFFPDRGGIFFIVALLAKGTPAALDRAKVLSEGAAARGVSAYPQAYEALSQVAEVLAGRREVEDVYLVSDRALGELDFIEVLVTGLGAGWIGEAPSTRLASELSLRARAAAASGFDWVSAQCAAAGKKPSAPLEPGLVDLAGAVRQPERWMGALDQLLRAVTKGGAPAPAPAPERDLRLVWVVGQERHYVGVAPLEQSRSKGRWSKGRPVALKRLYLEAAGMDHLSEADRRACAAIEERVYSSGRYRDVSYHLGAARALSILAGQPNLLTEVAGALVPLEVRERAPRISVQAEDGGVHVSLDPAPRSEEERARVVRAGPMAVELVRFTREHHAIAEALGRKGLVVPRAGEPRLREVLGALAGAVAVQADLAADGGAALVEGDPTPRWILRALGEGLSIEVMVRPLGGSGSSARAGEGGAIVIGAAAQARRDLDEEARQVAAIVARCPTLAAAERTPAGYVVGSRDVALEVVVELGEAGALVEWPDGEALRVAAPLGADALSVKLRGTKEGFEVSGSLATGPGDPLALDTLLSYLDASPGRFVRLEGEPTFVALTAALRSRLDALRALSTPGRELRFHRLALPQLDALLEGAKVRADAACKRERARLEAIGEDAGVPSTFRGELRPYQLDGFRWLARLGRWGAGACLADDMGLGKTLQTIALLLLRAPEGPSLVVAPTSVLPSLRDELARFAPTLRSRLYAGEGRAGALEELSAFDVVLTSYTLLQQDVEALARQRFVVAVLDEAQAIKNAASQRARAAYRLDADQRVVTTGTPIENRAEDLWSLFRFLNPGLLGSAVDFQSPLGGQGCARLRSLVAPFLLRRTKSAVLAELPPKTEIALRVDLHPEELALYELVREEALATIDRLDRPAARRMHLLAALTKLRRAACNARLVVPSERRTSAKLEALGELLDELLPGGHKLLVFSQFVDHLAIARELLVERGVSHQYLDGKTSMRDRKAAVDAFQAGASDAFLISLKAGGVGLNLTAADYVVHLDPWWNPAAEDQASDRAHRIGQRRPVTVYRIVARHTIEDGILALHHQKRDLAATVLAGSDAVGSVSEEELLALIRDPR